MVAYGSSYHWARQLHVLGHDMQLIATNFVKPFDEGSN